MHAPRPDAPKTHTRNPPPPGSTTRQHATRGFLPRSSRARAQTVSLAKLVRPPEPKEKEPELRCLLLAIRGFERL